MSKQLQPKSIEANLVSLGVLVASLGLVLLVALVAVGQGLGGRLEQMQDSIVPAEQAVASTQHAMASLFQRQSQVLATRTNVELEAFRDRSATSSQLTRAGATLRDALRAVVDRQSAESESTKLEESLSVLLTQDEALFDSIERKHGFQEKMDSVSASSQVALQS